ncbi:MAG: hypothetical protein IJJ28_00520 [Lentisphaeria bacterium]|nr:hypothetical protein [Lentisphaeria bacterium]
MIFRKFGGSYQFWVRTPEELPEVARLDPALWAALSVPAAALNADRKFLSYLDVDANGIVRLDDVTSAIGFVQGALRELSPLADPAPEIALAALRDDTDAAKTRREFIAATPELVSGETVKLADVGAKLNAVASGAWRGDGILRPAAVAGSGAETLYAEVLGVSGGEGITAAQLDKFPADAAGFLEWAKQTQRPKFRDADPEPFYAALLAIRDKVDEFFRFCELIRLDTAHARRFMLDPENLPPLDLKDGAAVTGTLLEAPLRRPSAEARLELDDGINPGYRDAVKHFAELFGIGELTPESWAALQAELAPYAEYLSKAQGDNIGRLGEEKLAACLADGQPDKLRDIFAGDGKVGGVIEQLKSLEKLILFKQYLWPFINNFVCFKALFTEGETSMIQAGHLVMDGRTFALTLWIDNIAAHKSIAVKSHLCLIYLELVTAAGGKRYVAAAVTAGDLKRIYIGKPAFFIDSKRVQYNGRVVDLVAGPISFWQTVMAPFRRLGEIIGGKAQKFTDFSSTEKAMGDQIGSTADRLSSPAKPAPAPAKSPGLLSNSSMLLLAGGLSIAALGAAASYAVKTVASIAASVAAMPPWRIAMWVAIIAAIIFLPLALHALIQLRRRNLTLFLEAAGWAINLPMRLNAKVSRFFTFFGIYPEDAKFKVLDLESRSVRTDRARRAQCLRRLLIVVLIVLIGCGIYCWKRGYFCCRSRCSAKPTCAAAPAKANASVKPAAPAKTAAPAAPTKK